MDSDATIFLAVASFFFSVVVLSLCVEKRRFSSSSSSSSSSRRRIPSPSHGRDYEVFLSFCGADTRKGFADCLYRSLKNAGVDVFMDRDELHVGEDIGLELLDRIKRSKISIPIFSENYASRKWCLREIACMMECRKRRKQTVLPIFYKVTPDEVQHQEGSYAKAFSKHEKDSRRNPMIDVQKWKKALNEVGAVKGWDLQNDTMGYEGQLIEKVVQKVLRDLKERHLNVTKSLVSIDDKKRAVMRLLEVGKSDVRIIRFFGMGGVGKTTLAKVIYNEIMDDFASYSFLKDVRETSLHLDGLKVLQSRLVADLSRCRYEEFATTDEGTNELQRRFRKKKVLIVLDDVKDNNQLEALVSVDWFGPGSRVIVTTRYRSALSLTQEDLPYEVEELKLDQSMELFCRHAFRRDSPTAELSDLSLAIVEKTGGLPLALQVIGSSLCGKSEGIWKETLQKLQEKPHPEVQESLKISYDLLDDEQKEIFLDIACHFIGEDRRMLIHMWDDCKFYPQSGLDELILRSLIKTGEDNRLWMHDQLRDLGREIVRREDVEEPGNRSRLCSNEEAISVLKEYKGSPRVRTIRLDARPLELEDRKFTDQNFRNMSRLRFLQIDYADLDGNFQNVLTKLRYLRWRHSGLACKPANLGLTSLIVLDLSYSEVKDDWEGWRSMQIGPKLKVLILHHCHRLTRTPDFSLFPNLEVLILKESKELRVIDPSIGCLTSLLSLDMDLCASIEELPPQLCFLKSLEVFSSRNCHNLRKLEGIEKLEVLKELNLQQCEGIIKLPNLSNLKALRKLDVSRCRKLEGLEGLEGLVALKELFVQRCRYIEKLPNLSNLRVLRKLDVSHCQGLEGLEGLEGLVALEELFVQGCLHIEKLPNLSNLEALRKLDVSGCNKLEGLEGLDELVTLEELSIGGCNEIVKLPNLSNLKALIRMKMGECGLLVEPEALCGHFTMASLMAPAGRAGSSVGCAKLRELVGLDELLALQVLSIVGCTKIEKVPNLSNLKALRQMHVERCGKLRELEGFHGLVALEKLFVQGCGQLRELAGLDELVALEVLSTQRCTEIEKLPNLSKLKSLKEMHVDGCQKLREFEGLDELVALQVLSMRGCRRIEKLPNLLKLRELRKLRVDDCESLKGFEGLNGLVALDVLSIDGCKEIEKLHLSNLKLLRKFSATGCKKLRELRGLEELEALTLLVITESVGIEELPNLSGLKHLKYLRVCSCPNLVEIHALNELESLKLLEFSGCEAIQKLPNLQSLKSLEYLLLDGCSKLQELDGVDQLNNLAQLSMRGCREIKKLPTLSRLDKLRELSCKGCEILPKAWRVEAVERLKRNGYESFSEEILLNGYESSSYKSFSDISLLEEVLLNA